MKWRPMLFQGPMVRGILDGSKTNTRRIIKPQPQVHKSGWLEGEWLSRPFGGLALPTVSDLPMHCPHGAAGDGIWVREAWTPDPPDTGWGYTAWAGCSIGQISGVPEQYRSPMHCLYAASWPKPDEMIWKPSIHMPRWASRINLGIERVVVERLHDISEEDAIAEGVKRHQGPLRWVRYLDAITGEAKHNTARDAYFALWAHINGQASLDANPYVWSIHFRRLP